VDEVVSRVYKEWKDAWRKWNKNKRGMKYNANRMEGE
jgi:hypothetical protein